MAFPFCPALPWPTFLAKLRDQQVVVRHAPNDGERMTWSLEREDVQIDQSPIILVGTIDEFIEMVLTERATPTTMRFVCDALDIDASPFGCGFGPSDLDAQPGAHG